jgi:hypothetical protein
LSFQTDRFLALMGGSPSDIRGVLHGYVGSVLANLSACVGLFGWVVMSRVGRYARKRTIYHQTVENYAEWRIIDNGGKHNRTNLWRVHVAHMPYTSEELGVEGIGVAPGYITRARYDELREAHPGVIIAWRVGDFYEFYGADAIVTSQKLDLTLTGRQLITTLYSEPFAGDLYPEAELFGGAC